MKPSKKKVSNKIVWNYRILAFDQYEELQAVFPNNVIKRLAHRKGDIQLRIVSVYYAKDVPTSYGQPATILGDNTAELTDAMTKIHTAFNKPILWGGKKFPAEYKPKRQRSK